MNRSQKHKQSQQALWRLFGATMASLTLWGGCASAPASCPLPPTPSNDLPTRGIAAHQGGLLGCPVNTIGAFQRAIARGVHQIELDVRLTADKIVVVAHDDEVTDKDNSLRISESTLHQIRELDLGPCKGEPHAQHIPTLKEALAIMPQNIWINVDIKNNDPQLAKLVAENVSKTRRFAQVIFAARDKAAPAIRQVAEEAGRHSWIANMSREMFRAQYVNATLKSCANFIQLVKVPFIPFVRGKPSKDTMDRLNDAGVRVNYSWLRDHDEGELTYELHDLFDRGIGFVLVDHIEPAMNAADKLGIPRLVPHWDHASRPND